MTLGRVVTIPRYDEDGDEIAPHVMDPCAICRWNYDPAKERAGVYRDVSPLFYYPHGHVVCRWCMARPLVCSAIREIADKLGELERTLA